MVKEKNFLFVCGCPRSGTTVLTQLLNWHPQISVGMERYGKLLYRNPKRFIPRIFGINRFFDIRQGDCFYDSFEFQAYSQPYCSEFSRQKYQQSAYVGDKNPKLYQNYAVVRDNFAETNFRIIFILRDVYSVAESYNLRAYNPDDKWKADNNFKQAIVDWNESISAVSQALEQQHENLIMVNYDDFFSNYNFGKNKLPILFDILNLKVEPDVLYGYQLLEENAQKIAQSKTRKQKRAAKVLEEQQRSLNNPELFKNHEIDKEYITSKALLDKYNSLKKYCI